MVQYDSILQVFLTTLSTSILCLVSRVAWRLLNTIDRDHFSIAVSHMSVLCTSCYAWPRVWLCSSDDGRRVATGRYARS